MHLQVFLNTSRSNMAVCVRWHSQEVTITAIAIVERDSALPSIVGLSV